jgi:polysaccharide biosynthesis transport protein
MNSFSSSNGSLQAFWLSLKYHRWLALGVAGSVMLVFLGIAILKKPIYQAEGKIKLDNRNSVSQLSGLNTDTEKFKALSSTGNPVTTEVEVIKSGFVIEETLKRINRTQTNGLKLTPKTFLEQLTVSEAKGADIVRLQFTSPEPKVAAVAINTLMAVYLDFQVQNNRKDILIARQFIDAEFPKASIAVQKKEAELRAFKQENSVAALPEKAKEAELKINDLSAKITESQSQLEEVNAQLQSLSTQLDMPLKQAINAAALSQSPVIQDLLTQIQKTEANLRASKERLTNDHPQVIELENDLAKLETKFQQRSQAISGYQSSNVNVQDLMSLFKQNLTADLLKLDSARRGLIKKTSTLESALKQYQQQFRIIPRLEQQQNILERDLQVAQTTYSNLLNKRQEIQFTDRQQVAPARIISPAIAPNQPVARKGLYLFTGFFLGSILGLGAAHLAESLNPSIRTIAQLRSVFYGWPVLGVIPPFTHSVRFWFYEINPIHKRSGPIVQNHPKVPASEAFRTLQINLLSLERTHQLKSLVVTSSVEGEGKSTIAANLAVSISQAGQRVLLIDANFHHPSQYQMWNIANEKGLSDIMMSKNIENGAVQKVTSQLDVLSAGSFHESPSIILEAQYTAQILKNFESRYDMVIIDTPAVKRSADALMLASLSDGVMMVVRPNEVTRLDAVLARETYEVICSSEQSNHLLLGIVVNAAVADQTLFHIPTLLATPHSPQLLPDTESSMSGRPLSTPDQISQAPLYSGALGEKSFTPQAEFSSEEPAPRPRHTAPSVMPPIQPLFFNELKDRTKDGFEDSISTDIQAMPLSELKIYVEYLQQAWESANRLIVEEEEELHFQENIVSHLQEQVNIAHELKSTTSWGNQEVLQLLMELNIEQERKHLLDETLIGQRRRLHQQQTLWEEALRVLIVRQSLSQF